MIMMIDFIHALSHFHKIYWCEWDQHSFNRCVFIRVCDYYRMLRYSCQITETNNSDLDINILKSTINNLKQESKQLLESNKQLKLENRELRKFIDMYP
jgi:hypothetical protein